jgi:hypothetical protein
MLYRINQHPYRLREARLLFPQGCESGNTAALTPLHLPATSSRQMQPIAQVLFLLYPPTFLAAPDPPPGCSKPPSSLVFSGSLFRAPASMQQFRLSQGSSSRCTATGSTSSSRVGATSRAAATTAAATHSGAQEVATASAESALRRQLLQSAAAVAVAAVLPLAASAAPAAGDWTAPGLAAPEGEQWAGLKQPDCVSASAG